MTFKHLPSEVASLNVRRSLGYPVGLKELEVAIEKYPEHFPEEYERKKRWDAIPKEVHDSYFNELLEFKNNLWKDKPVSPGIFGMIENTPEYQKWNEAYKRLNQIEQSKDKELRDKYYSKYGF